MGRRKQDYPKRMKYGSDDEEGNAGDLPEGQDDTSDDSSDDGASSPPATNSDSDRLLTAGHATSTIADHDANAREALPVDTPSPRTSLEDLPAFHRLKELERKSYSILQELSDVAAQPCQHPILETRSSKSSVRLPVSSSVPVSSTPTTPNSRAVPTPKMRYMSQYRRELANRHKDCSSSAGNAAAAAERDCSVVEKSQKFHTRSNQFGTSLVHPAKRLQGDNRRRAVREVGSPCQSQGVTICEDPISRPSVQEPPLTVRNSKMEGTSHSSDITGFTCSCGESFSSLRCYTVHMGKTGHATNHSTQLYPHKLVRGQDMWLVNGSEQTQQILKCIRCGESFKSLPDLTIHMMRTQHYTNIVSPGQMDEPVINEKFIKDTFKCKVCSESFANLAELTEHITCHKHYKGHILKSISERAHKLRYSTLVSVADDSIVNDSAPSQGNVPFNQTARIRCEYCGVPVNTDDFSAHVRQCVTAKRYGSRKGDGGRKPEVLPARKPVLTQHSRKVTPPPVTPPKALASAISPCLPAHSRWRKELPEANLAANHNCEEMPEPLDLSRKSQKQADRKGTPASASRDAGDYSVLSAIQSLIDRRFKNAKNNQSYGLSRAGEMHPLHTDAVAMTGANPAGLPDCVSQPLPSHQHARAIPNSGRHRFHHYPGNHSPPNAIHSGISAVKGLRRSAEKSSHAENKDERQTDKGELIKNAGSISLSSNMLRGDEKQRALEFQSEGDCHGDDGNQPKDDIASQRKMIDRVNTERLINVKIESNHVSTCFELDATDSKNSTELLKSMRNGRSFAYTGSSDGHRTRAERTPSSRATCHDASLQPNRLSHEHYRAEKLGRSSPRSVIAVSSSSSSAIASARCDAQISSVHSVTQHLKSTVREKLDSENDEGITMAALPKGVMQKSGQEQSVTGAELRQSDSRRDEVNSPDREANEPAPTAAQRSISSDESSVTLTSSRNNSPPETDRKKRIDEQSAREQRHDYDFGPNSSNGNTARIRDRSVNDSLAVDSEHSEQRLNPKCERWYRHREGHASDDHGNSCTDKARPAGGPGYIHHSTTTLAHPSTDINGKSSSSRVKEDEIDESRDENLTPKKHSKDGVSSGKNGKNMADSFREALDESPLNVLKRKFAPDNNNYHENSQRKYTRLSAEILVNTSPVKENPLESLQKLLEKKIH
ncbi:PREDICTED: teashirt homolog 1-like [Priapulus caudatus]|uniref:Teashirt homolog 1-like n=1 Tax=Priapulus caudatus TaxID=37621 RepID=A0ABM1F9D5_PRICU|nr:PREDICTED: teashirt homolog 1-like [Priapulus caudatus]